MPCAISGHSPQAPSPLPEGPHYLAVHLHAAQVLTYTVIGSARYNEWFIGTIGRVPAGSSSSLQRAVQHASAQYSSHRV